MCIRDSLNPERLIDEEATKVHGISNQDLEDKPLFQEIAEEFLEFIQGSTLVIHNADFDVGFLNNELNLVSSKYPKLEEICEVIDSLSLAREKFPGQRNSLDALANRFDVTGYDRTYHGALLDANILADVYMLLTGGQSNFEFSNGNIPSTLEQKKSNKELLTNGFRIKKIQSSKDDIKEHNKRLDDITSRNNVDTIWNKIT